MTYPTLITIPKSDICKAEIAQIAQQGLGDLNDKLGLVPSYDELTTATLKADFLALLDKLPKEQQAKYLKDIDHMTPARFEKGIQFIQNQLAKQ